MLRSQLGMQKKSCGYPISCSPGGSTRREVGPVRCILDPHPHPHFMWRGGSMGSAMLPFERALVVSYRLSIVTTALSLTIRPQFAIECLQRWYQQRVGHFGAKFGEEGVDRCKPNFTAIWERHGAVMCKRNCFSSFCRLRTMQERDRQSDRPRNGKVTLAMSPKNVGLNHSFSSRL